MFAVVALVIAIGSSSLLTCAQGCPFDLFLEEAWADQVEDEYFQGMIRDPKGKLDVLHTFDRDALSPDQQISYDIFEWYLDDLLRHIDLIFHRLYAKDVAYAYWIHHHTTTDLTANDLHEIGLQEVSRIQAEMEILFVELGITGDTLLDKILQVGTRSGGLISDEQDLISAARKALEKVIPELPTFFDA